MEFVEHLHTFLTPEEAQKLNASLNEKPINGLRTNTLKISSQKLHSIFPFLIPHPIVPDAFIFDKNTHPLGKHILHEMGAFYIQEPSAMLVAYLLNPQPGDTVIDLAAAPGGKSTHAATLMNGTGIIWANDISFSRAKVIRENVERLGFNNFIISAEDPSHLVQLFPGQWDKVILDAPCSGEGMFRKNKDAAIDWSMAKVESCALIQKKLIIDAYRLLRKGGKMIYSTCTFSKQENEDIISFLLSQTNAKLLSIPHFPSIDRGFLPETIRVYPHHFQGEGHFIALIESTEETSLKNDNLFNINYRKPLSQPLYEAFERATFVAPLLGYKQVFGDYLHLFPYPLKELRKINLLYYGTPLGETHKNHFVPSHALSRLLILDNYQRKIELSLDNPQLKAYLHGEEITIDNTLHGYCIVSCCGLAIGWGKAVKGRLKNEFPKGRRIP